MFDRDLIQKYDTSGPRYTSYPTALQFTPALDAAAYMDEARRSDDASRPLSLYVHIPFCDTACYYCACNKIATKDRSKSGPYLDHVRREIARQAALFSRKRPVEQLHFGGGTPTFLSGDELAELVGGLREHFSLDGNDHGEYSIEIDPREVDASTIERLRSLGFNRMSLGVQDFDPAVQKAVNRVQSEETTMGVLHAARAVGFRSVSVDLIYGLPFQSKESFLRTIARIIEMGPDRISIFNYAHLPERFKQQRRISASDLPDPLEKLAMLDATITALTGAGYVYIGMDHFARPDDELSVAQREGKLHRNFQGYSTHAHADLVGIGVSAISKVGDAYAQNHHAIEPYYQAIDRGGLAIFRGVKLDEDDKIRREVISELICHFRLSFDAIEKVFGISFESYFRDALLRLSSMQADGLLTVEPRAIVVHPPGKLLIRNICMAFDRYLPREPSGRYSKVI